MLKPLIAIKDLKRYSAMPILNDIYTLKQAVDALRPFDAEREARILQKIRLEWNYNSNAIEGNSLTFGETIALLMNGVTAKGKPLKDHLDIKGHDEAIDFLMSLLKNERPLSEADIRQLHVILLKQNYETDAITADGTATKKTIEVGKYKTTPNHVKTKTGQIHYYAAPNEVPILMCELVDWYNVAKDDPEIDTIVLAAFFHHRFVAIHPFGDGNGRMTRLLCNLILMRKRFPPIVIKKTDRETYYGALSQADASEYLPFLEFIAEQTQYALHIQQRGALGETIDEDDDFEKELFLLEKMQKGNEEFVEKEFSEDNAKAVFENSLLLLFESVGEKVKSASKLFLGYDFGFYDFCKSYKGNNAQRVNIDNLQYVSTEIRNLSFADYFKKSNFFKSTDNVYFVLSHILTKFKKASNPFDIQIDIIIRYENTYFSIYYIIGSLKPDHHRLRDIRKNKTLLIKSVYHKLPTEAQIATATKQIASALLQKIKELSSV